MQKNNGKRDRMFLSGRKDEKDNVYRRKNQFKR